MLGLLGDTSGDPLVLDLLLLKKLPNRADEDRARPPRVGVEPGEPDIVCKLVSPTLLPLS